MAKNPVVLIHGLYDTAAKFNTLAAHLRRQGWSVGAPSPTPNDGSACLKALAQQVATFIDRRFEPEQAIDLLGFSMGGLITRYYLQRLGGIKRVQRYISISAPNKGTIAAYSLPLKGIRQMRPQSDFIQDLNRDWKEYQSRLQVTTLWTPFDLMILPASSSCCGWGQETVLPIWVHARMVEDPRALEQVVQALSA
jgi:triacylglycerol lipase